MSGAESERAVRLAGLRRFATAITALTVLGHIWLGFEQAWLHPIVGLATAYASEIVLDVVDARLRGRPVRFLPRRLGGAEEHPIDFLLSAHISGLAVAMLLYPGERVAPIAFAAATAIASKYAVHVRIAGRERHLMNPSNFGIATTLLLFPSVGIAAPYMFTEELGAIGDWALPSAIIVLGSLLNARYTRRLPLIAAWVLAFLAQGALRSLLLGQPLLATWMPVSGMAWLLFTFYMVTDPATTPVAPRAQVVFGVALAATYAILMALHVVFGLFFALVLVCLARGCLLVVQELLAHVPAHLPLARSSTLESLEQASGAPLRVRAHATPET